MTVPASPEFGRSAIRIVADGALRGRVARRESTGADLYLDVETDRGVLAVRVGYALDAQPGEDVSLELPPEFVCRFDRETGRAIA